MICIFKIRRLGRPGKMNYIFFSSESFTKILSNEDIEPIQKQKIILSMLRINILTSIQKAGSGHLGTSMSVLEIMLTALMYLKNFPSDESHFFSSKLIPLFRLCILNYGFLCVLNTITMARPELDENDNLK